MRLLQSVCLWEDQPWDAHTSLFQVAPRGLQCRPTIFGRRGGGRRIQTRGHSFFDNGFFLFFSKKNILFLPCVYADTASLASAVMPRSLKIVSKDNLES